VSNDVLAGNDAEVMTKRRGWGIYASHIGPGGSYMRRYIFRTPWFTLRLHHILRSDDDRHLHDHPFDFTSFLLTGGYTETVPCDCGPGCPVQVRHWWPCFSIVRKKAEDLHCLKLDRPVWTLVFAGPKRREWGFATEDGWVHNEEYAGRWPERVTRA
jgi:hypothetical protein